MIYHYCSLETMVAILQGKEVWASNHRYLNDYNEVNLAIETVLQNFDLILSDVQQYKNHRVVVNHIKQILQKRDFFVTSFSAQANVLSQWRAYSDNGNGVCIGFDEEILINSGNVLVDVVYGKKLIDSVIEVAINHLQHNKREIDLNSLEKAILPLIGGYKSGAFKEEQEKRLLVCSKSGVTIENLCFRKSNRFVVPYVKISFSDTFADLIQEIWLGPANKDEDTKRSVLYFLNHLGYTNTTLKSSLATYRP